MYHNSTPGRKEKGKKALCKDLVKLKLSVSTSEPVEK